MNSPEYTFACKPTKGAFRNERDGNLPAMAVVALDWVASKPMGRGMRF